MARRDKFFIFPPPIWLSTFVAIGDDQGRSVRLPDDGELRAARVTFLNARLRRCNRRSHRAAIRWHDLTVERRGRKRDLDGIPARDGDIEPGQRREVMARGEPVDCGTCLNMITMR